MLVEHNREQLGNKILEVYFTDMPIHIVLKHFFENDREKLKSLPVLIS